MRLTIFHIGILLGYCAFMTAGQLAFKSIALSLGQPVTLSEAATRLPFNVWFWATGFLYFLSTIYWTWLLTKIPLAIAYPFVSLTLIIVPLLGWAMYSETVSLINVVGMVFVVLGVALVAN